MANLLSLTEEYLNYLKTRNYSKTTIKNYEINLRFFYSFCKTFNIDFLQIRGPQMMEYLQVLSKYKSSTVNLRLSVLKGFYEYLINIDLVAVNPIRESLYVRKDRKKPKPLTKEQEDLFIDFLQTKQEHIKVAFMVLLNTGIRLSELKKLTIDNFVKINNKYYIEVLESKNQTNRIVPISFENYKMVLDYAKESVFYGNLFNLTNRAYQYHADIFQDMFNIEFSVHSLRHTYATRKSQQGLAVQIIQKLLGHKNINTTMYYIEVTDKDILNLEV